MRTETWGGLTCRVLGGPATPDTAPDLLVVLCHGYGAPGQDLVPLGAEIVEDDPVLGALTRFVFPAAPILLEDESPYAARAWWPLDERTFEAAARGKPLEAPRETPPELPIVRGQLTAMLDEAARAENVPRSRVVLGGFSQGAMLALDTALHLPESVGGLVLFSGTLLSEAEWSRLAPRHHGVPVLLSHGRQDPLLSFTLAESLRDLLSQAGLAVDWLPFDGPHTIPPPAVHRCTRLLRTIGTRGR